MKTPKENSSILRKIEGDSKLVRGLNRLNTLQQQKSLDISLKADQYINTNVIKEQNNFNLDRKSKFINFENYSTNYQKYNQANYPFLGHPSRF